MVCVFVHVCVERKRRRSGSLIYFQALAHMAVGAGVSKPAGQAGDSGKS